MNSPLHSSLPPDTDQGRVLAICERSGAVTAHNDAFQAVVGALSAGERAASARSFRDAKISSVLRQRADRLGTSLILTFIPVALIDRGHCDAAMADILAQQRGAAVLMVASGPQTYRDRLSQVLAVYGLSHRQAGIVAALVATGSVRRAAIVTHTDYAAARTAIVAAREKTGSANVNELIHHVTALAMGAAPSSPDQADTVCKAMGLTPRQYGIACGFGVYETRAEVAASLGLSESVVAAALKDISVTLGVSGAGEMTRLVCEARIAALYTCRADPAPPAAPGSARMLTRADGSMIGYSDYGPVGAPAVLILHSTITTRHPPTALIAALHRAGFRPLTIDRPGFGDSDPVSTTGSAGYEPWRAAAHDVALVCAALGLDTIDVVARGCGHAAVLLQAEYPHLIARAVLVNPTPSPDHTGKDVGALGAVKRRYLRAPWVIGALLKLLSAFLSPTRMRDAMRRSFRASPPDVATVDDPVFINDYFAAIRTLAETSAGYIAEQQAWATGAALPSLAGRSAWRIIFGDHFVLHDPDDAIAYWRTILPDTPVVRHSEAGQLLAYTHPHHVVAALAE